VIRFAGRPRQCRRSRADSKNSVNNGRDCSLRYADAFAHGTAYGALRFTRRLGVPAALPSGRPALRSNRELNRQGILLDRIVVEFQRSDRPLTLAIGP
jgi:hypothetical protein